MRRWCRVTPTVLYGKVKIENYVRCFATPYIIVGIFTSLFSWTIRFSKGCFINWKFGREPSTSRKFSMKVEIEILATSLETLDQKVHFCASFFPGPSDFQGTFYQTDIWMWPLCLREADKVKTISYRITIRAIKTLKHIMERRAETYYQRRIILCIVD